MKKLEEKFAKFPKLLVFDLDDCMYSPEMYTLNEIPTEPIRDNANALVVGASNGRATVKLFDGALKVLQMYESGEMPEYTRIAAASSADTKFAEKCALASLKILEVVPGKSVYDVFKNGFSEAENNLQIGRRREIGLSSNKGVSHLPNLQKLTSIEYKDMIFFDDCQWGDNCAEVRRHCPGITTMKTPHGMTVDIFEQALKKFNEKNS
eukprot:maker-scaffold_36-snap-gene-1.5-mRNA-1 protein AED:0.02 eAED:0.02 QI:33/1/1/1/1/1/2/143/207